MIDGGHGRLGRGLIAFAGLFGASGVALGAASAHLGGGEFARLASFFLLVHAAAVPAILAVPIGTARIRSLVAGLMALGTVLFSGDLGILAFTDRTPIPGMAPCGGLLLIAGWFGLFVAALFGGSRPPEAP